MERGILIHPDEFSTAWIERLLRSNLRRFGLHPVGGTKADRSMEEFIRTQHSFTDGIARLERHGITVEHEMHVLRWMLPEAMFSQHPDWFRMNEKGERVSDFNLCVSNADALEFIRTRAAEAALLLPAKSHRYHFWTDDVRHAQCFCPDCRRLTASDQAMAITNAIAEGLRRSDPLARECYLAYYQTLFVPRKIEPVDGVYLEFAPMGRDYHMALDDPASAKNADMIRALPDLFACFGERDSLALDYWLDNSMYSRHVKPPKEFRWNRAVTERDLDFYEKRHFCAATTFACFLGDDYEAEYGAFPDIEAYLTR